MADADLALTGYDPPSSIKLTKDETKMVNRAGPEAVRAVDTVLERVNRQSRWNALQEATVSKVKEIRSNFSSAVAEAKGHTTTVLIAGGLGGLAGFFGTRALRDYFAVGSWLPDLILPIAGVVLFGYGISIKDPVDKPGLRAGTRSAAMGAGGGLLLGSVGNSIYTRFIA